MNILILECCPFSEKTSQDAHVRQCFFIKKYLESKGHKVDMPQPDDFKNFIKKYDVIIKSYTSFYENYKDIIRILLANKNSKIFYLTNEYKILNSCGTLERKILREAGINYSIIANFNLPTKKVSYCVNLNCLFFKQKQPQKKRFNICYYGTFRENRAKYFKKYFNNDNFILSTSPKNFKKFKSIGCKFKPCQKFVWNKNKDTLGLFKYSLYIEDEFTHTTYNHLADRFYEALSNDTIILFDKSCLNTLQKSEIKNLNYQKFVIDNLDNLNNRNYEEDLKEQNSWKKVIEQEQIKNFEKIEKILLEG